LQKLTTATAILAAGRAAYSFWYIAVGLLAAVGMEKPLWSTPMEANSLGQLDLLQYLIWFSYAAGYALTAYLLINRSRWAMVTAGYAFAVDMSYWVTMATHESYVSLMSLADGYLDLVVNSVNFLILIGTALVTARQWLLPVDRV